MEASRPLSFMLLPSRLTVLRRRLKMDVATAAARLGLTPGVVQYIEDHTRRFSSGTWSNFDLMLTPVDGPHPVSIWDWLAELDADEARQARAESGNA
jgi:hypothetical protein